MLNTLPKDSITDLREKLDYGDRTQPRFAGLNDALRFCSSRFRSSSNIAGPDLYDWHDRAHQTGLDEITTEFLDIQGRGGQFWPDSPSSPYYNTYSYSRDRDYIRGLIKNLFFRLIAQTYRNHRYKERKVEDPTASRRGTVDNLNTASTEGPRPLTLATSHLSLSTSPDTEGLLPYHQLYPSFTAQGFPNTPPPYHPPQEAAAKSHTKRTRGNDQPDPTKQVKKRKTKNSNDRNDNSRYQNNLVDDEIPIDPRLRGYGSIDLTKDTDPKPSLDNPIQTTALEKEQLPVDEPVPAAPITATAQLAIHVEPVHSTAEAPRQSSVEKTAPLPTVSAEELSTLPKLSITFFYRVQPSPTRPSKRWYPEGRFQDKTLSELLMELPFEADIKGLVFTIPGTDIPVMEQIMRDDEDGFKSMKCHIVHGIKRWHHRERQSGGSKTQGPRLGVSILIEPIVGDNVQTIEEMEEVEFDW